MTNKVKPFFIRITDDMAPQMVQDAFDKCHNLGVRASNNDDVENLFDWGYFGVCARDGTYLSNSYDGYFDAQEITLDQLDEWLGLDVEQEWKNGDSCIFGSSDMSGVYITYDKYNSGHVIYSCGEYFYVLDGDFHKPETPEQKAERERLEDGKSLFELAQKLWTEVQSDYEVYSYDSPMICDNTKELYARLAEKVGYSKQKTDRNQLEVAYDLYIAGQESLAVKKQQSFQQFTSDKVQVKFWLAVADKAGYRKQ